MSSAWDRFVHEAVTSDASLESGVHGAQTRPAPYLEELDDDALIGSIPRAALYIQYAPIVDLHSFRTVAFDCALHCRADGLTRPEDLLARAKFEHSLGDLGRISRELALQECRGRAVFVPVHLPEIQEGHLLHPDDPVATHDAEVFALTSLWPASKDDLQIVRELCDKPNVKLAIDDFGAEHSNIAALVDLAPDLVKLTPRLVDGLVADERRQQAVARLLELISSLGAHVVAKGLRNEHELKTLRDCGVRFGQGLLFGAPRDLPHVALYRDFAPPPQDC